MRVSCHDFGHERISRGIQVDMDNLSTDTWQNNFDNEVFPVELAFDTTPIGAEHVRFSANVQVGAGNMEGEPTILPSGSSVNNAIFPFVETVQVSSVSLRWNNGGRRFFVRFYTSMDGQNWTEATITDNAERVTVTQTYDAFGDTGGPAAEVFATIPAGVGADDPEVITFALQQTPAARFFKIQGYGSDGESGELTVSHAWFSFNNLRFEGNIFEEPATEAPAETTVEAAPAAPAPAVIAPTPAPRTADPITLIAIGAVISAAGIIAAKKKK